VNRRIPARANVDARVFFWPLSELPMFDRPAGKPQAMTSQPRHNLPTYITIWNGGSGARCDVIIRLANVHQIHLPCRLCFQASEACGQIDFSTRPFFVGQLDSRPGCLAS